MRRSIVGVLLVLCACSGVSVREVPNASGGAGDGGIVERVVDGDTLIVVVGAERLRVRLIGIDTPETVKPGAPVGCYGPQASSFAKQELTGEHVLLRYDRDRTDRYGRTLAYVYRGDELFNETMVARGYATVLTIAPNDAHEDEFERAERDARAQKRGLWGACPLAQ